MWIDDGAGIGASSPSTSLSVGQIERGMMVDMLEGRPALVARGRTQHGLPGLSAYGGNERSADPAEGALTLPILLVRHPPAAILPGICHGRLDLALHDPADATALAAGLALRGADIVSSPARRCRSVAAAIGPHRVDARLLELDFGAWEGRSWDSLPRAELDRWAADPPAFAAPGGETGAALLARVRAFWSDLADNTIVIAHGGPLKLLAQMLRGAPADLLAPPPHLGEIIRID